MTQAAAEAPTALAEITKDQERAMLAQGRVKWSKAQVLALKELCVPKDATAGEILGFWHVCMVTGLDPFMRQIYLIRFGAGEDGEGKGKCSIVAGIDGLRKVLDDTGTYAGSDEPTFEGEGTDKGIEEATKRIIDVKHPMIARITIWKIVQGQRVPFYGVARWNEFARYKKDENIKPEGRRLVAMWSKMPHNQLAKCSEAQGCRKAAPAKLSGIYTPEELGTVIDVVGTVIDEPRALPGPGNGSSQQKSKGGSAAKNLWNAIMEHVGGNSEEAAKVLKDVSSFGSGADLRFANDWKKMSDGWANKSLERFKEKYGL